MFGGNCLVLSCLFCLALHKSEFLWNLVILCVLVGLDFLEFCWFCYCWFCCLMVFDYFVIWVCILVVCVVLVDYCVVWCLALHKIEFWLGLGFRIDFLGGLSFEFCV